MQFIPFSTQVQTPRGLNREEMLTYLNNRNDLVSITRASESIFALRDFRLHGMHYGTIDEVVQYLERLPIPVLRTFEETQKVQAEIDDLLAGI